ncbi:MAG: transposase [Armatimonadetes bacterium]|nr:transposase [Armatimonadota bacterium]
MRHRRLPRVDLPHQTYYLTCCTHRRRPFLRAERAAQMIIDLYAAYRDRGDLRLHGYVVMPNHYHVVVTLTGERSVSGLVRKVHGLFSWRWHGVAGHEGLGGEPPIGPALRGERPVAGHEGLGVQPAIDPPARR